MQHHPNVQAVQAALTAADARDAAGAPATVRLLPDPVHTAAAAAAALDVQVGQIANSLVFDADGEPLLVLTSGAHRADTAKLAAYRPSAGAAERSPRSSGRNLEEPSGVRRVRRASAEFVRDHTGQPIGGVAPLGHPKPLPTLIDQALAAYQEVWAAGGVPQAIFPITYPELVRVTGATPAEVA